MAESWTITPSEGVTNNNNGTFVFDANTSFTPSVYTIDYTDDSGCTGTTTYTIPGKPMIGVSFWVVWETDEGACHECAVGETQQTANNVQHGDTYNFSFRSNRRIQDPENQTEYIDCQACIQFRFYASGDTNLTLDGRPYQDAMYIDASNHEVRYANGVVCYFDLGVTWVGN